MSIPITDLKSRLTEILNLKNIRPIDLATRTGIPKSSISQYMSGYAKPNAERVFLISKVLNVNEPWLMGFDVPMERKDDLVSSLSPSNISEEDIKTALFGSCEDVTDEMWQAVKDFVEYIKDRELRRKQEVISIDTPRSRRPASQVAYGGKSNKSGRRKRKPTL